MRMLMNSPLGVPICAICAIAMLVLSIYLYIKIKFMFGGKWSFHTKMQDDFKSMKKNETAVPMLRWTPFIFFCGSLWMFMELAERTIGGELIDNIMYVYMIICIVGICLVYGISGIIRNVMGKDTQMLEGVVVNLVPNVYNNTYRVVVEYTFAGSRNKHGGTCNYSKKNCPSVGQTYDLIYSYKYDKIMSKDEIRQNRKGSIYGFVFLILFILLIGARFMR